MRRKVTNRLNLPRAFVEAIQNDPYDPDDGGQHSDYTITGLLDPPRAAQLERENDIVEDAADLLPSLQGQVIHGILERAKDALESMGCVVEKRFYKTYIIDGREYVVSAKVDVYDSVDKRLTDYKYTSVASAQRGLKNEHKWQVNFQALLCCEAGYLVNSADATILMHGWSAERVYSTYPSSPCVVHKVPLLSKEEVNAFIVERIRLHEAAKTALPNCSQEERWERPTYAVMKTDSLKGKATRVYDTQEEAEAYLKLKDPFFKTTKAEEGLTIVTRPGKSIRCLRYCPARTVCEQAKQYRKELEPQVDEDSFVLVSNNKQGDK